ncbi:extracellular catalytic domain type 1 short-chain-length polyhydroxyalkanoate depolymerase [Sedimentitalea todarodis]|uniref:PHB depolymerase family esterase n=1 Tax=Sedimentitalea todarodis TaxID=1631240 RepID=A0ABU3VM74_9RHOB|nr:PHB depolymerase family esterase [Sedimentitalea todarodis]MDU9006779.1 PHB depolymerase family esterase [Sedimentitalea todarodis]
MKLFNGGALRPATDSARLKAANDLVQRTLAQHGLVSDAGLPGSGGLSAMDSILAGMTRPHMAGAAIQALPDGARFDQDTYTCPAGSRMHRTYVPASTRDGATGVVMMLHGCTQTPEDFAAGTGMNVLAEQLGFVVVYPAQSRGDNAQSCWNWFSRGDQRRGRGEPAILAGLARQIASEHDIARDRSFVAGLSAGGAMAAILGETYPDVFAAVGIHSGLPMGAAKDVSTAFAAMGGTILAGPARSNGGPTVRTIVFHGTSDATVHPKNGERIVQRAIEADTVKLHETTEQGEDNGRSYERRIACDDAGADLVEYWTVEGQGHAWSGGSAKGSYTDSKGPDASAEMVRFFFDRPKEVN